MQARYRPTMAYQASTVLIQGTRPTRRPLPVLTLGVKDIGISVQPNLLAPNPIIPTLSWLEIVPSDAGAARLAAELGDTLELRGVLLDGDTVRAEFRHPLLASPISRAVAAEASAERVRVNLPDDAAANTDWPSGNYTVALRIERAGKPKRLTNGVPFSLAPRLLPAPKVTGTAASPQLTLNLRPQLWPGQRADVFVAGEPFSPAPITTKTATLTLPIRGLSPGPTPLPVVVRVDGVDTQLVRERAAKPPEYDPKQLVSLPA
jgi:hypothetical protein